MSEVKDSFVRRVESTATPEQRYFSWLNSFTDPKNHDAGQFTYFVHGLGSPIMRTLQSIASIELGLDPKIANIDLEREPLRIAEKPIISSSVIDPRHRATWGDAGLILRVPPENILNIFSQDAGTRYFDAAKVLEQKSAQLACTVEELLEQTQPTSYNEVIIQGSTEAGNVEIIGFFIKKFSDNSLVEEELAKKIVGLAYIHNLPRVEILDSSPRTSKGYKRLKEGYSIPPGISPDKTLDRDK